MHINTLYPYQPKFYEIFVHWFQRQTVSAVSHFEIHVASTCNSEV